LLGSLCFYFLGRPYVDSTCSGANSSANIKLESNQYQSIILVLNSNLSCDPVMLSRRKWSGDPQKTLLGGLRVFWLNHWQIQTRFSIFLFSFFLKIFSGFASDLAKISGDPPETPRGGSPGGQHCWVTRYTQITCYQFLRRIG
jgi:hypothetical protein